MTKIITEAEIKTKVFDSDYEFTESCNYNHCVTNSTKLIIVGTITPPAGAGYFYSSPFNKIYGYLDECFLDTNLKTLKMKLHNEPENQSKIISEIKNILVSKNVAFLDVIKFAIRKKDSPSDNDIKFCSLDEDVFKINPTATYICNSRLAESCFKEICEKLNISPSNQIYLSQRSGKKADWLNTIKQILS